MEILGLHSGVRCTTFFLFAFQTCPGTFRWRWGEPKLSSLASKSPEASALGTGHSSHSRDIGLHLNFSPFSFFLPVTRAKWIILHVPHTANHFKINSPLGERVTLRAPLATLMCSELTLNQWPWISQRAHGNVHTRDGVFSEPRHTPAVGIKWISHVKLSLTLQLELTPLQPDLKEIS